MTRFEDALFRLLINKATRYELGGIHALVRETGLRALVARCPTPGSLRALVVHQLSGQWPHLRKRAAAPPKRH